MARKPQPQCPNCKQYKVDERRAPWLLFALCCFFAPFAFASVLFITIIGIPLALIVLLMYVVTIPLGIVILVVSFRVHGYRCKNCGWVGDNPILEKPTQ